MTAGAVGPAFRVKVRGDRDPRAASPLQATFPRIVYPVRHHDGRGGGGVNRATSSTRTLTAPVDDQRLGLGEVHGEHSLQRWPLLYE
jgi:hypothetical protein